MGSQPQNPEFRINPETFTKAYRQKSKTFKSCLLVNFACFYAICQYFSRSLFLKTSFRITFRVSNSLDPDQA